MYFVGLFGAEVSGHMLVLLETNVEGNTAVTAARKSAKGEDGASLGGIATHEDAVVASVAIVGSSRHDGPPDPLEEKHEPIRRAGLDLRERTGAPQQLDQRPADASESTLPGQRAWASRRASARSFAASLPNNGPARAMHRSRSRPDA